VIAEAPRLAPHREAIRRSVAALLEAPLAAVSIQVTSTDGLGAIGRGEGIAAQAVVLLRAAGGDA
jgi:2-C-methyl-D-erythritol 2,4-cyclodiphosphate synthase